MCFSAPASFIASGGLAMLGGASLLAKKENKILAAVPILFGVQQAIEGIQWLYLDKGSSSLAAGYGFLFFAFIVWPIYVPTMVYILDKKNRHILQWFILLGIAAAIYSLIFLLTGPLAIQELNACVSYSLSFPLKDMGAVVYFSVILGPLFFSSLKILKWFGVVIFILGAISWFFFTAALTSVWCFFAAIVSLMLLSAKLE